MVFSFLLCLYNLWLSRRRFSGIFLSVTKTTLRLCELSVLCCEHNYLLKFPLYLASALEHSRILHAPCFLLSVFTGDTAAERQCACEWLLMSYCVCSLILGDIYRKGN